VDERERIKEDLPSGIDTPDYRVYRAGVKLFIDKHFGGDIISLRKDEE
jgi:hypothetical protein